MWREQWSLMSLLENWTSSIQYESPPPRTYPMSMLLVSCGEKVGPSSTRVNLKFTPYNPTVITKQIY